HHEIPHILKFDLHRLRRPALVRPLRGVLKCVINPLLFSHMLKSPTAFTQPGSILSQIGGTPLLRFVRIAEGLPGIEIHGKAEYFNPGGSVKDRPALNMILDGERTGKLDPRRIILDSTSGNTGIAYAMIGAARGYKVKICLP